MNIKKGLVKFNESSLPESFVALAVKVEDHNREPEHAAILIRYRNVHYLHHYAFTSVFQKDFNTEKWYIYKVLDLIKADDDSEVGAFLKYCERIYEKSDMTYSFITDGSSYDESGEFQSKSGLPELGTCVSYCLNTLTKLCYDYGSYLQLEDWENSSELEKHPLYNTASYQTFNRFPELENAEMFNAFRKRITPLEYLSSAFFNKYPIRKEQIDGIVNDVKANMLKKLPKA